jgi:uncharacterized membrane protein
MNSISRHFTKNILAGVVAILPIGGLILTIGYLETSISSAGLTRLPFYFPGLGILLVLVLIYLVGLILTTFIGKWLWNLIDKLLNNLPALGKLYQTLKQILGYGEGEDAIFQQTVLVPAQGGSGLEIGLVTNRIKLPDGSENLVIFIPGSPNPTSGRLIISKPEMVTLTKIPVNSAFKILVAAGKSEIEMSVKD